MTTFLIADDFDVKRMMLVRFVQKSGIATKILEAKTSEEAMELIDSSDIDFAFIDYEIPSSNGPAIIEHLTETHPATKIALVSSSNSERYQDHAFEAGADTYICTSLGDDITKGRLEAVLEEWGRE